MKPFVATGKDSERVLVIAFVEFEGDVGAVVISKDRYVGYMPLDELRIETLNSDMRDIFDWPES